MLVRPLNGFSTDDGVSGVDAVGVRRYWNDSRTAGRLRARERVKVSERLNEGTGVKVSNVGGADRSYSICDSCSGAAKVVGTGEAEPE